MLYWHIIPYTGFFSSSSFANVLKNSTLGEQRDQRTYQIQVTVWRAVSKGPIKKKVAPQKLCRVRDNNRKQCGRT